MKPIKQSEWENLYYSVNANKEMHLMKMRLHCDNRQYIVAHDKVVMYLEDRYNPAINAFIDKYYDEIVGKFYLLGYSFIYAPREVKAVMDEYVASEPDVEWNAATLLEALHCHCNEPIGAALALIDGTRAYRYAFPDQPIETLLTGVWLDADTEEELVAIFKAYWDSLDVRSHRMCYCTDGDSNDDGADDEFFFCEDGVCDESKRDEELKQSRQYKRSEERKYQSAKESCKKTGFFSGIVKKIKSSSDDLDTFFQDFLAEETTEYQSVREHEVAYSPTQEYLSEEDEQLLSEILELIERLHHTGIRQRLIEQMVRMTVKPSTLKVTDDARLLLTNYGKEVKMLPIDKLVYIFFLRHPEGIALKDLADHKEELTNLYERILGKRLTQKQVASIKRLCNPLDNSINEKLSRIRQAFRAVAHDSVANCYIVQGERGELRNITLNEELIELGVWGR